MPVTKALLERVGIVGQDPAFLAALARLERIAELEIPVLINAPSGAGKELAALLLHLASGRAGRFVVVNCATLPKGMEEAEMFGHQRGAFTGADEDRPGLFAAANTGTLFLDEVAEAPLDLQAKLLRAIELGEVRAVGSAEPSKVDVRIVAATNRNLSAMAAAGEFREDLYYRISAYPVELPPLRDRGNDSVMLARLFLKRQFPGKKRLMKSAVEFIGQYKWPGNVRQLRYAVLGAALDAPRDIEDKHIRNAVERLELRPELKEEVERIAMVGEAQRPAGRWLTVAGGGIAVLALVALAAAAIYMAARPPDAAPTATSKRAAGARGERGRGMTPVVIVTPTPLVVAPASAPMPAAPKRARTTAAHARRWAGKPSVVSFRCRLRARVTVDGKRVPGQTPVSYSLSPGRYTADFFLPYVEKHTAVKFTINGDRRPLSVDCGWKPTPPPWKHGM